MQKLTYIPMLLLLALLFSCGNSQNKPGLNLVMGGTADSVAMIAPQYAKGFNVKYADNITLLEINDPENKEAEQFHFALVDKSFKGEIPNGYTRLNIPIRSAICMTSLQLSNFLKLDIPEMVVGITSTRHLHNQKMNQQLKEGKTHKIGIEGNFDNEVIIAINPDVIFISPFKRGGYDAIRNVEIPMIPHLGYKELTPLGQAEWIKVIGLLTGNASLANSTFEAIESRYNNLKSIVDTVKRRPTVFSGEMRGGNWYAVGGKSFLAQLFKDAGADYFLKDDERSGGVTLDFETVYNQADNADYWRIVNSYPGDFSYEALKDQDARYADFKAFREHGIIYCNMKTTPFYEEMPTAPEVILADLLHIFHPELLPDHQPVFYKLLKK